MRKLILMEITDVLPIAVGDVSIQRHASLQHQRIEILTEIKLGLGWDKVQHLGFEDVDAGIDGITKHLAPRGLLEEPRYASACIGHHYAVLKGLCNTRQNDGCCRALGFVECHGLFDVDVGEHVA